MIHKLRLQVWSIVTWSEKWMESTSSGYLLRMATILESSMAAVTSGISDMTTNPAGIPYFSGADLFSGQNVVRSAISLLSLAPDFLLERQKTNVSMSSGFIETLTRTWKTNLKIISFWSFYLLLKNLQLLLLYILSTICCESYEITKVNNKTKGTWSKEALIFRFHLLSNLLNSNESIKK